MTSSNNLSVIENIYDKRAPSYDAEGGFHSHQAADYIEWMSIQPGFHVLDLACGTGAITIPAAKAVQPNGQVIGVDISGVSISICEKKAMAEGLNVVLIQNDVTKVHELPEIKDNQFDIITCASAFVLLEDGSAAVRDWARLLKPGGRLIFDVLTKDSLVRNYVMDLVGKSMQISTISKRESLDSQEKVWKVLTDAGLNADESFLSRSYQLPDIDASNPGMIFENIVTKQNWAQEWYSTFNEPSIRDIAKTRFCEEMEKLRNEDGKVGDHLRCHMAVGKKMNGA